MWYNRKVENFCIIIMNNQINKNNLEPEHLSLNKKQKIAAGVLVVFGMLTIVMWIMQLKNNINGPFSYYKNYSSEKYQSNDSSSITAEDNKEELKTKDSDKDGLSDWDELYTYNTSAYLEDSDSDGFTDKQEIDNNKDPNCPTGRDCSQIGVVDGDKAVINQGEVKKDNGGALNNLLDQSGVANPVQSMQPANNNSAPNPADIEAFLGKKMDAATLRQLLSQAGMQQDMLDKISDEELIQEYEKTQGGSQ